MSIKKRLSYWYPWREGRCQWTRKDLYTQFSQSVRWGWFHNIRSDGVMLCPQCNLASPDSFDTRGTTCLWNQIITPGTLGPRVTQGRRLSEDHGHLLDPRGVIAWDGLLGTRLEFDATYTRVLELTRVFCDFAQKSERIAWFSICFWW